MTVSLVVFMVFRNQVTVLDFPVPQHPLKYATESKLEQRKEIEMTTPFAHSFSDVSHRSNRQDEDLRWQRDGARVEHEPDGPPEPDDQLVDEVLRGEGEGLARADELVPAAL